MYLSISICPISVEYLSMDLQYILTGSYPVQYNTTKLNLLKFAVSPSHRRLATKSRSAAPSLARARRSLASSSRFVSFLLELVSGLLSCIVRTDDDDREIQLVLLQVLIESVAGSWFVLGSS